MNLYAVQNEITEITKNIALDENGELLPSIQKSLNDLVLCKETKVLHIGRLIKNLSAEAVAIKAEIDALTIRKKRCDKQAEWLKWYLTSSVAGQAFKDSAVEITWRRSVAINIIDKSAIPKSLCKHLPESWDPDKILIKTVIGSGQDVAGAEMIERNNIQIK